MPNPFDALGSTPDGDKSRKKKSSQKTADGAEASTFPRHIKGHGGCRYERIDDPTGGGDVVYVPLGASHAKVALGWRAKHDRRKGRLYFVRLSDVTERTWRLPSVPEEVLLQHGVLSPGGRRRERSMGNQSHSSADEVEAAMDDINEEEGGEEACDEVIEVDAEESGARGESLPLPERKRPTADEAAAQSKNDELFLTNKMTRFEAEVEMPMAVREAATSAMDNRETRLYRRSGTPSPERKRKSIHKEFKNPVMTGEHEEAPELSRKEIFVPTEKREPPPSERSHLCGKEEKKGKEPFGENRIASRLTANENVLVRHAPSTAAAPNHNAPTNNMKADEDDDDDDDEGLFLRNTRLSSFDDAAAPDDAVTPLEKLLRAKTPDVPVPAHQTSGNRGGPFVGIYEPPADRPSARLLVAQRHQLEMERQLAQRQRDQLERALDDRMRRIEIPVDAHAQLRYAPTRTFAEERQSILNALPTRSPPRAEPVGTQRSPSAVVSPISQRTFVPSPSPTRRGPPPGWREALFAEAFEAKCAAGLSGMERAMELRQRCVATAPSGSMATQTNPTNRNTNYNSHTDSHTELDADFARRLERIHRLCAAAASGGAACVGAKTHAVYHHRRPLTTPPLPPSLQRPAIARRGVFPLEENGSRRASPTRRRIATPLATVPPQTLEDRETVTRPVLRWDAKRSGNVLISHKGTTCLADASRALQMIAAEARLDDAVKPNVSIPMYAIGTIGVARGEFIFEVRIDAHPSSTPTQLGLFAVGVATKYYLGPQKKGPAYLYRSNGTIVAIADDAEGVPYGRSYHSGSHITVHLDLTRQQLSFFLNGKPLGVAFRFRAVEDPEPLFPVVLLSGEGDTASFVPPSPPQLPARVVPP